MFKRLRLWWRELRLQGELGKYDAYLNRIDDTKAADLDDKLAIAMEMLRRPPLSKGERWAESQRVVDRQEATLQKPVVRATVPLPTPRIRLFGGLRTLLRKVSSKAAKDVVVRPTKKAPLSGK